MSLGFGRVIPPLQKWIPYNDKIADITETDTNKHFLDLETALSETRKIIAVVLRSYLQVGTGTISVYPNEGTTRANFSATDMELMPVVIASGTQRLQYAQTVANDDFDVHCMGYVVEA